MKCPFCGSGSNRVIDKRSVNGTGEIRRRRECLKCQQRFTTYERLGSFELVILKKDGRKEPFMKDKLRIGIAKALEKRPALDKVDIITERIEKRLRKRAQKAVLSKTVGQMVLAELKKLDSVAYLRFASVYRRFETPLDFARELTFLKSQSQKL